MPPLPTKDKPPPYDPIDEDPESSEDAPSVDEEYMPCVIRYITALSRTAGVILVCVLWLFTGLLLRDIHRYKYAPWYLLAVAILTTFFEVIWMINKCVVACMRQEGCCCQCWRFMVWIDTWRKSILYIGFAIPCFLEAIMTMETIVSGVLLIFTAMIYFVKSFKESTCIKRKQYKHAVVQTSPQTNLVAHGVQMGAGGKPPNYAATHTLPSTVQPRTRPRLSSPRQASMDEGPLLDPAGRKRQRYSSPTRSEGADRAPFTRAQSARDYADGRGDPFNDRDRDRYDDRDRRDRYDDRDRGDRYDDGDRYGDRDRDRYDDRGRGKGRRYSDGDPERRDPYDDRDDSYRRPPPPLPPAPREKPAVPASRYAKEEEPADRPISRTQSERRSVRSPPPPPPPRQATPQPQPQPQPQPPLPKPRKEEPPPRPVSAAPPLKPANEPPPLKELPPQASEALKKSAAAGLVKQVSSGSPVLTTVGSAPSGMPGKLEIKAAKMDNPYSKEEKKPQSTNPFDESDEEGNEDEYFD